MAYTKQTWNDDDPTTPTSAARLQHIEDGLSAAATVADSAQSTAGAAATNTALTTHVNATAAHGATGAVVGTTNTQTLTNKTVDGNLNTLTVLQSQVSGLSTALSAKQDASTAVTLTGTQTLTNKTLTAPVVGDFTNANHTHTGVTSGGTISIPPGVPTGAVSMFAGSAAPSGWLICDGSPVSRTTYSALFTAIGTRYGAGDGSTTFNLPNMVSHFATGMTTPTATPAVGGTSTHGHANGTVSHSHGASTSSSDGGHSHGASSSASQPGHSHHYTAPSSGTSTSTDNVSAGGISVSTSVGTGFASISSSTSVGSASVNDYGASASNLPPYVEFNFIIKA